MGLINNNIKDIRAELRNNCFHVYYAMDSHNEERIINIRRRQGRVEVQSILGHWLPTVDSGRFYNK